MVLKCLNCGNGQPEGSDGSAGCSNCGHSNFAEVTTTNLQPEGDAVLPSVPNRPLKDGAGQTPDPEKKES